MKPFCPNCRTSLEIGSSFIKNFELYTNINSTIKNRLTPKLRKKKNETIFKCKELFYFDNH